jgi:hypothetical protein
MLVTVIVVILVVIVGLILWTRRGGNSGERDVDGRGVHDVGRDGPGRDNTPRGGNAAGR